MIESGARKTISKQKIFTRKVSGKRRLDVCGNPEVLQDEHSPFGWVKVKGRIDDFEFKNYKLMPMGNGRLFLPVKAAIRKKIGKRKEIGYM